MTSRGVKGGAHATTPAVRVALPVVVTVWLKAMLFAVTIKFPAPRVVAAVWKLIPEVDEVITILVFVGHAEHYPTSRFRA